MKTFWSLISSIVLLAGCSNKDPDYIYGYVEPEPVKEISFSKLARDAKSQKIDIVWVVDNSGSMSNIQKNISENIYRFMDEFLRDTKLDWKMGIISTDNNQAPFLGFDFPFDSNTVNAVDRFRSAFSKLGTNGSNSEYVFNNIQTKLEDYPTFIRPSSLLAVIMVTDEKEQSSQSVPGLLNYLQLQMLYNPDVVRFYGILEAKDFPNCSSNTGFAYTGSKFEDIIKETNGFVYSACNPAFSEDLEILATDILNSSRYQIIPLAEIPQVDTIKVSYGDQAIPGGRNKSPGWYYNPQENYVVVQGIQDEDGKKKGYYEEDDTPIKIEYTTDNGLRANE